ncbi:MAG: DKNYY domain-containing protein [Cyclobacteriaceae bacterium]|nr:DKNYY domain-containing protein [Cyclobacteriaceae bacterium]
MRTYQSFILVLLLLLFFSCDKGYEKSWFGGVTFNENKVDVQDWWSFEILQNDYARDVKTGYYRGNIIDGSDGKTFEYVWGSFAKDKNYVYSSNTYKPFVIIEYVPTTRTNTITILDEDPSSFVVLDNEFAKGNNHVYTMFDVLESADASTFESLGNGFAKDNKTVFFGSKILKADPATFQHIRGFYSSDQSSVFYEDSLVRGVDIQSFEVLDNDEYAKDKHHIYKKYDTIDHKGVDLPTFQMFEHSFYALDKNNVFYKAYFKNFSVMKGVDMATFKERAFYAKDKNNYYIHGDIIKEGNPDYDETVEYLSRE